MKRILYILLALVFASAPLTAKEVDANEVKAEADSAYVHEKFEQAAKLYSSIEGKESSAVICYNLGCCYYRLDDIAKSVLWFERAYLLNPGDEDIRFNLDMVRSKTIDKIVPQHEFIFVSAFRSLVCSMNLNGWAYTGIISFVASLLCFAVFFFSSRMVWRKGGFFAGVVLFLVSVCGNICGSKLKEYASQRKTGIVMSSAVTVKSVPSDNGNDLFVIHEGTKVSVTDNSMKDWCEVKVADGKVGWIKKKCFELI